tara:strand:+ start:3806 stop:4516 length:711 start_codon:yes stop_codon:yes gene_type:complete
MVPMHIDRLLVPLGLEPSRQPNATIGMNRDEGTLLLKALLRPTVRTYLEWGTGGSTELVAHLILLGKMPPSFRAVSIESSPRWIDHLYTRTPLVRAAEKSGLLRLVHGDMGATGFLGYPKQFSPDDHWRALGYVSIANRLGARTVDVALVDGRFRLACLMEVLPHLSRPPARPIALLHDYSPTAAAAAFRYAEYSKALAFYDARLRNGTLVALTPKRKYSLVDAELVRKSALSSPT